MIVFALSTAAQIVAGLIVLNFIVRTIIFTTLKHFGAYDPRWDLKWPRAFWRVFWLSGWIRFQEWKEENFSGGAAGAGMAGAVTQLALTYEPGHSLIGRTRLPLGIPHYSLVGEPSQRHKVYIASARSGKSLQLETEIALMPDDACAIYTDPKGSITNNVGYALERRGHELCVLDPMAITNRPTQQINLLAQIDLINERLGQDRTTMICDRIASLFFPHNPNAKNPFFDDTGRELWARLMCFAKLTIPNATMLDVRRLATVGLIDEAGGDAELAMAMLWVKLQECDPYDRYVSQIGGQILAMDDRTRENVLATVRSRTAIFDHEQVKSVSRGNSVNLCDLKDPDKNLIIALPAPVGDMRTTLRPWIGAIVSLSLAVMEWVQGDLKTKTRFIIEEAQAIGESALPNLGDSAALMAGMGVQLIVVVQDMAGFSKAFPSDYKSIIGNAQHVIFMATNDPETYDYIAEKAFGNRTKKRKKWFIPFLWTVRSWEEPVITPDKVRRYLEAGRNNAICMRNGKRSMFVKIAKSYQVLPVWMLDPSRDHGESPPRAWFRSIYESYTKTPAAKSQPLLLSDQKKLETLLLSARPTSPKTNEKGASA
ncbi:type IV secretory system conjugative DNA transfer family protein [uncultured Roseibium sp.]|uniref:type IV secretory system conjugative DNA transfer family protein n=1 Tax=uncultured Roseibium sp. TaxID=1936171 RepID=UPI0026067EBB|nr:type IV secretory system conjugative DNA transfer family protein [uncultured Roseibium sp.]